MRRAYRSRYTFDNRNPYKFNAKRDGVRIVCPKTKIDLTEYTGESTEDSDGEQLGVEKNGHCLEEADSVKDLEDSRMGSKENISVGSDVEAKKNLDNMSAVISAKEKLKDEAFTVGLNTLRLKKVVKQNKHTMKTIRSRIYVLEEKLRKNSVLHKNQSLLLESISKKGLSLRNKRSELKKQLQKLDEDVNEKSYVISQQTNTLVHTSKVIQSASLGASSFHSLATNLRNFKSHLCFLMHVIAYNFGESCFVPASTKSLYKVCLRMKFQLWETNVFEVYDGVVTSNIKKNVTSNNVQWPHDLRFVEFKPFLSSSLFRLYPSFPPELSRSVIFNNSWIDRHNPICPRSLTGDCFEINCLYQHLPSDMDTTILRSSIRDSICFISSFRDDSLLLFLTSIAGDINIPLNVNIESLLKENTEKLIDIICKGKTIKQLIYLSDLILCHARKFIFESNYVNCNKLCKVSNFILHYVKSFNSCNYSKYHWMRSEGPSESTSASLLDGSSSKNVSDTVKNSGDIRDTILNKIMSVNIRLKNPACTFEGVIRDIKEMIIECSKVSVDLNLIKIFCSLCNDNSELLAAQHMLDIRNLKCNSDFTILRIFVNNCSTHIESYGMMVRYLIRNYCWRYEESEHEFLKSRLSLFFYEAILSLALFLDSICGVSSSWKLIKEVFSCDVVSNFYNLPAFFSETYLEPIDLCSIALLYLLSIVSVSINPFFTISQILPPIVYNRMLCCIKNQVSYSIDNCLDETSSLSDLYARIDFNLTDMKSETLFGMLVEVQGVFNILNAKEYSQVSAEFSFNLACECNMCKPRMVYRPEIGLLWKLYSSIIENTCNFEWFINNCRANIMNYAFQQDFFAKCYLLKTFCCSDLGNYREEDYIDENYLYMKVCPNIFINVVMELLEQGYFTVVENILEIVINKYIDDFYLNINFGDLFTKAPYEVLKESHFNSHVIVESYVSIRGFNILYSNETSKNDYTDFYMLFMLYSFLRHEKIENERLVSSLNTLVHTSADCESDRYMFICYFFLRVSKLFFRWSVGVWKEIWLNGFIHNFARIYSILRSFKQKRRFPYHFYRYLILRLFYHSLSTKVQNQLEIYGFLRNNVLNFESTVLCTRYMEMLCIWCKESYARELMRKTVKKDEESWATWMQLAVYAASQDHNIHEVYEYLSMSVKTVLDGRTILAMHKLLEILEEANESRGKKHLMN